MTDINAIISNLKSLLEESIGFMIKINNIKEINSITKNKIELLSNISTNSHLLKDELEELYYLLLDNSSKSINVEDKDKIRQFKINNKIQEMFLPYMIYTKILLENDMTSV